MGRHHRRCMKKFEFYFAQFSSLFNNFPLEDITAEEERKREREIRGIFVFETKPNSTVLIIFL
jgi:hypothetical protein